jgi:RNA polymerase sigma factor (sigma-70 family)
MELTDKTLMLAVRDGDVDKIGVLFERYYARLFDFLYRMTGDSIASEDLVQEVFLRMLKYRSSFGEDSQFKAWMYHIARNARIDFFRKRRSEGNPSEVNDQAPASPVPADQALERRQHNELLARALMVLPEEKRELLVLARYQEMKYDEIAALLEIEVGTVKVRVHRAMVELRDAFLRLTRENRKCAAK